MTPARAVIVGASGHGKVIADVVRQTPAIALQGFVDAARSAGTTWAGAPVLGDESALAALVRDAEVTACFLAIGDNWIRHQVHERIRREVPALRFPAAVHPAAVVGEGAVIETGAVVLAGAVVGADARVGRFAIVNAGAVLDHDAVLGNFASLAVGARVGGAANVGDFAAVESGATVVRGRSVGEHALLQAGAALSEPLPAYAVAAGVPARQTGTRRAGDRYL